MGMGRQGMGRQGMGREGFKETSLSDSKSDAKVIETVDSDLHKIEVVDTDDGRLGKCLLLDGKVQMCERDEHVYHEMLVHFPAMYLGGVKRVVIACGGDCMALREVLKYESIEEVVVIEEDEHVISLCEREFMASSHRTGSEGDTRVRWLVGGDPKEFVLKLQAQKRNVGSFDLIIVDTKDRPGATSYDREFLDQARLLLSHSGVMVRSCGRHGGLPEADMKATFAKTLLYTFHCDTFDATFVMVLGADFDLEKKVIDTERMRRAKVAARFYKPDAHFSHVPWFSALKVKPSAGMKKG